MLSEANYLELTKYLEPHAPSKDEYERFVMLKREGLVKLNSWKPLSVPGHGEIPVQDTWIISEAGKDALADFEQARQQHTKQERQQRFENKVSVASVLIPLVTFLLGLLVEYYVGILAGVSSLFHS